jgi:hypothetical protein
MHQLTPHRDSEPLGHPLAVNDLGRGLLSTDLGHYLDELVFGRDLNFLGQGHAPHCQSSQSQ